jgi:hypothetical protein
MSYIEDKLIYYINSANRVSGTHSNFVYKLDIPPNKLYTHVTLLDLYLYQNLIILFKNPAILLYLKKKNKEVTITVPPGNYSLTHFLNTSPKK